MLSINGGSSALLVKSKECEGIERFPEIFYKESWIFLFMLKLSIGKEYEAFA